MGFSDAPIMIKVALSVSVAAFLIHIIGFSTESWVVNKIFNFGLWAASVTVNGQSTSYPVTADDILRQTRAFECLGLIAGLACTVLINIYIFVKPEKRVKFLTAGIGFGAGVLILIGIGIYSTQPGIGVNLGYSFGLTTGGGVMYIATGGLLLLSEIITS